MNAMLSSSRFLRLDPAQAGLSPSPVAQCMAEFAGSLYVGTGRIGAGDAAIPARILRRHPDGRWEVAYEAPLTADGRFLPYTDGAIPLGIHEALAEETAGLPGRLDAAYLSMAVFQGAHDEGPALYIGTLSLRGGRILRTRDGENFEPVCAPGMGNPAIAGFTALTAFGGRLHAAAACTVVDGILDRESAGAALVFAAAAPAPGHWQTVMQPGFGDPDNAAVTCLHATTDHLYAGTANRERGYQLWRTDTAMPHVWEQVLVDGAHGFTSNPVAASIASFDGAVFVASGTDRPGFGPDSEIGTAALELVRVEGNGDFELIAGRPRFTPHGLKVPLSMAGPGMDDVYNATGVLAAHDGTLYLGTWQWEAFRAMELGEELCGGYQLWASEDGTEWACLLDEGAGDPSRIALSTLLSTEQGLWAGTADYRLFIDLLEQMAGTETTLNAPRGFDLLLGR